ncbi:MULTISPECIES: NarK family nitrate/nitrite MFS transporter [unclassified Hahella]|uniref:NarK family nitrate/nitrite MFS transporter n=1 Tax=unclassified Hahella TaxID=2624107 RepID=UPI001C1F1B0D|nr:MULTISPECIES: NarK family nitrate/nitrite MFS transporter [unclassified Hahella]MBU6951873.1 NarK family nitrate/nitrite MFS transporter [Hahella sp. HN01]MDG9670758.1 NarK family nitrate/nitrite MFS transporter [Hahella sp. CR1]
MSSDKLNILDLSQGGVRTLHYTWFAFFLTFVMWFSHAPMKPFIVEAFNMSNEQWKALLILNVALTIPARIVIGMLVDKFGPRAVYSLLLMISAFLCWGFAFSTTFEQLALFRFLCGFIGAGFVIGIRLVGEWFPAKTVGVAEGVYGGWGNFGSTAAAWTLPSIAAYIYGGDEGWRYAIATTGVVAFFYGLLFYRKVRNTPKGSTYFKPKKSGGLEVSSWKDFWFYIAMNLPMYIALAVLTWKLSPAGLGLLSDSTALILWAGLGALFIVQFWQIYNVNHERLKQGVPEMQRYKFKQVAVLDWAYFVTFGSELAVVSMLPAFFMETFGLSPVQAGLLGGAFALMNLVARPGGGLLSDRFGRKKTLSILIAGLAVGYLLLSQISSTWMIAAAVASVMFCSFFVQAGEGAVFAMVPLVQRRMTGQIAGMAGAYGNVGGVTFLTVYSFVDASTFFMVIAGAAAVCFLAVQFLDEPEGHMVEVGEDGSVQLIEVN